MELHQLRSFLEIVDKGNFSRAAEKVHLSQPALTRQIKDLEKELDTVLLERGARLVRLTPQGRTFLEYARRILSLAEESRQALEEYREGTGRLIIGAGTTTIVCRLPDWLQKYRSRYPRVEITVRAESSLDVLEAVLQDRVDLGLVTSPVSDKRLSTYALFQDEILLLAADSLNPGNGISWQDLRLSPFLLFPKGTGFRRYIDDLFRRIGFEPRVALELDSIEGIKQLAAVGMGLSFLPRIAVEEELHRGSLVQIVPCPRRDLFRTTSLVMRKEKFWTQAVRGFIQLLAEEYPSAEISLKSQD